MKNYYFISPDGLDQDLIVEFFKTKRGLIKAIKKYLEYSDWLNEQNIIPGWNTEKELIEEIIECPGLVIGNGAGSWIQWGKIK